MYVNKIMHIQNSPQNCGISPACRLQAWPQLYGNMHVGVPVETRHQAQPQSDLPMNDAPVMLNKKVLACRADLMTVDQTADWVRTLAYFNGWEEAIEYDKNFRSNQI